MDQRLLVKCHFVPCARCVAVFVCRILVSPSNNTSHSSQSIGLTSKWKSWIRALSFRRHLSGNLLNSISRVISRCVSSGPVASLCSKLYTSPNTFGLSVSKSRSIQFISLLTSDQRSDSSNLETSTSTTRSMLPVYHLTCSENCSSSDFLCISLGQFYSSAGDLSASVT